MDSILIIVAMIGVLIIASWARVRQIHKASLETIERFREHGALKEKKAKTLEEMGLRSKPKYPLLIRDNHVEALSQLIRQGIICPAEQEGATCSVEQKRDTSGIRFYLNEEKSPLVR